MAEIRFLYELVCWRMCSLGACRGESLVRQVRLPVLGCAVVLAAGCSMFGLNQGGAGRHAAPPTVGSPAMQTPPHEFQTPKWELAVPDRYEIDTWVKYFSMDKHQSFQTQLDRARFYVVPVQQIFEERGLPKDIVFVALVESGFSPTARSHASAVGMWQFISSTGRRFGLEQNQWVDERRHPFKAARAAADYLSFLYDMFGSWPLALAAYNAGENGVQGALDRTGFKTFWELAEGGHLPLETRDYVPKVLATVKIIREPQRYGFHFDPKHYVQRHDTVSVPGGVKLALIEKKAGVPQSALQDCNPELCKPVTPPGCASYELCVPVGTREMVMNAIAQGGLKEEKPVVKEPALKVKEPVAKVKGPDAIAKEPVSPKSPANLSCKVNPGETWFSLSRKYGCSPQRLALVNGVAISQPLKAGQTLKLPSNEPLPAASSVQNKANAPRTADPAPSNGKKTIAKTGKSSPPIRYPVRQGDTLWSISEKFSVPVQVLCEKNELKPNQKLIPGKLLTIYSSQQESARAGKPRVD